MADQFGQSFHCFPDLDSKLSVITGPQIPIENIMNRLRTPAGGLWYDPDFGTDLRQFVNSTATDSEVAAAVETEAVKEERVETATVDVTRSSPERIDIVLRLEMAEGPFSLTIRVEALTVALIDFRQAA